MLTNEQQTAVHAYIEEHRGMFTEQLIRISKIPSMKSEAAPGAPFGIECRRVLEECGKLFRENGFEAEILDDRYLLAYAGNTDSDQAVTVFSHADVVPVDDKWTVCEPFEPTLREGFLFGRGVHDNKCAVIYALLAAMAIRDLSLPFDRKLVIFVGSNEESGMDDIKAYTAHHGYPDVGIVPDASYPCVRGEKSILRVDAYSPKLTRITEAHGGEAYNIALGEVKLTVCGRESFDALSKFACDQLDQIKVAQDGENTEIVSIGLSKHASTPEGSVNAMLGAAKLLADCGIEEDVMRTTETVLGDYYGGVCGVDAVDSDFGKLTMVNGMVRLIDGRLMLSFDIRFGPESDLNEVYETLERWFAARGWELKRHAGTVGYKIAADDPKVAAAIEEFERFTGTKKSGVFIGGGTYARQLGGHAVPVGLELRSKQVTLPAGHGGAHQPDENAEIDGSLASAELLLRTLVRFAEI